MTTVLPGLNILLVLSVHKAIVKSALSVVNLNAPPYNGAFNVNDQFPPEVRELIVRVEMYSRAIFVLKLISLL